MKFFIHTQEDAKFAINRCYLEADHGRPSLAVDRLCDLAQEIPDNPHVLYAEGIIRRDYLGLGIAARAAFQKAYEYAARNPAKRETARLSAYNAAMLTSDEQEFRRWAGLTIETCGIESSDDKHFLSELLAELDRGVTCVRLLVHDLEGKERQGGPGSVAAVLEVALLSGELTQETKSLFHERRAAKLRELDKKTEQLRENMGEAFPPDERIALHEAFRELEKALELDPHDATLWNFKCAWSDLLGRYEDAIAAADRAIALRPFRYARPHLNKAGSLYHLGRIDEALASAREALRHAEEEGAPEQIEHARILLATYSKRDPVPTLNDLRPILLRVMHGVALTSQEDLEQVRQGGITIQMVVNRLVHHFQKVSTQPGKGYVPIMAQLLGDFTTETAFTAALQARQKSSEVGDYLFWATFYLAVHSNSVQRRDAARLLALMILSCAENTQAVRQFYRWNILEVSDAATDEMSGVDRIVRNELGRINRWLPQLIADQEPIDEAGRERARRQILSQFAGPPPEPIKSTRRGCLLPATLMTIILSILGACSLIYLIWG